MWKTPVSFFLLVSCLFLLSLSCRPFIPSPPELLPSPQALLERARQSSVRSIKALTRARISAPQRSGSLSQVIAAREPSSLRLEALGPLGQTLFILAFNGKSLEAYSSDTNVYYTGTTTQENITRFLPFALPPEALVSLALGKPCVLTPAEESFTVREERKGFMLSFRLKDLQGHQTILFSRDGLVPLASTVYAGDGASLFSVSLSDYEDIQGFPFPMLMSLSFPDRDTHVSMKIREVSLNSQIQDGLFSIPKPPDAEIVSLDDQ